MGTSQSSSGPGGDSPLVPPWADDAPQQALMPAEPRRFQTFRRSLGSAISGGNRDDFKRALGHYARQASGGSSSATRRMGSATNAGGMLFGALTGQPTGPGEPSVDLGSLSGLPCDQAISEITHTLSTTDGDSDKIRTAMNNALVEALDGVETFDTACITNEVLVDVMIGYMSECIFEQIVMDSDKAWNKADTPVQAIRAETELKELIKVVVDMKMAPKLQGNVRGLSRQDLVQIKRQAVTDAWKEWETYQ